MIEQLPRFIYAAFAVYGLGVLVFRWHITRVMTRERRFLMAALAILFINSTTSGVLKLLAGAPVDITSWGSVLTMSFFCAYLHYSLPPEYRRFHHRWSRRP